MMRSIELFTGAGGLALGTHRAGFEHQMVIERDRDACDTLRLNQRRGLMQWPIVELSVTDFMYPIFSSGLDLVAGGAPCQPFSLGGRHAGEADERNLFPEVFRAIRELTPCAFLLENVKGLLRRTFQPYFTYILEQLSLPFLPPLPNEGWEDHHARLVEHMAALTPVGGLPWDEAPERCYNVAHLLVNTADYGVPQQRHRVFIVGFRRDLGVQWAFPEPTHSEDALLWSQYVDGSYWAEHNLPARDVPERLAARVARLANGPQPLEARWRTVRDAISDLPEPINYDPSPPLDNHVGIPDARVYPGHTGCPWDWPAKTIKAGDHGNPGGENMLRRDDGTVRYFTTRELARLQTFPDEWHFANSWTESRRQLGNAVPVMMAELLAREIYTRLQELDERTEVPARMLAAAMAD